MRKTHDYIFFRRSDERDERVGWFLLQPYSSFWRGNEKRVSSQEFIRAYAKKAYGRCLLYRPCIMPHQCALMCFMPYGTGFVMNHNGVPLVLFRWQETAGMTWKELCAADPEALRPVCKSLINLCITENVERIVEVACYTRNTTLHVISHEFLCGSEAELRRLTTIIVQSDPELFHNSGDPVTVVYQAQMLANQGRMFGCSEGG